MWDATMLDRQLCRLSLGAKPTCPACPGEPWGVRWRDLQSYGPFVEMFLDRGVMGLRPTEDNEKRIGSTTAVHLTAPLSFCHPERSRADLQFNGPFVEMFLDRAW
jgi:hypothetical protein